MYDPYRWSNKRNMAETKRFSAIHEMNRSGGCRNFLIFPHGQCYFYQNIPTIDAKFNFLSDMHTTWWYVSVIFLVSFDSSLFSRKRYMLWYTQTFSSFTQKLPFDNEDNINDSIETHSEILQKIWHNLSSSHCNLATLK